MGGNSFDLNSHAGVMALLLSVRHSALPADEKAELRDLVFLYSSGGGDATVRRALEQKIATHGLRPVDPQAAQASQKVVTEGGVATNVTAPQISQTAPSEPLRPYGSTRPVPRFSPILVPTPKPAPEPAPAPTTIAPPQGAPTAQPEMMPAVPEVQAPAPIAPVEAAPASLMTEPVSPAVAAAVTPTVLAASAVPTLEPSPVAGSSVTLDTQEALERIRTIKAAVNKKIGNPVNLVDIDNDLGREYMMALLEAMKKVSGGMPGDLETAMARLERAFSAVEVRLASEGVVPDAQTRSVGEVDDRPSSATAPQSPDTVVMPPPPEVTAPTIPAQVDSFPVPVTGYASTVLPDSEAPVMPEPALAPVVPPPPPRAGGYRAASLADDTTILRTPNDLPDPSSLDTSSVAGDSLFTKEVDEGLEQLLSEWVLFKKSGIFATGPKGREHPLFKTLAPLTIPIIIAGRYSGASNEIRQSITDYMNGWRYEQGIVYDADETFEHYLRRVIYHIIDLQKRRARA